MDYVDWCGLVLDGIDAAGARSPIRRNNGIEESSLGKQIFGERFVEIHREYPDLLFNAAFDLFKIGLIEDVSVALWKLTWDGRNASKDIASKWGPICDTHIDPMLEQVLAIIGRNSEIEGTEFASVVTVTAKTIEDELQNGMVFEDIAQALRELNAHNLVFWDGGSYPDAVRTTYSGLVRLTRCDSVSETRFIDGLISEWETTSVEFKQELHLDSPSQKAEFVKDIIGLANTQASGRRWLIIGFDDEKGESLKGFEDRLLVKYHERFEFVRFTVKKDAEASKKWGVTQGPAMFICDATRENPEKNALEKLTGKKSAAALKALIQKSLLRVEAKK